MARKINIITRVFVLSSLCLTMWGSIPHAYATTARSTFTVTNTNNSGAGSLHQAIINANTNVGFDTIQFNIPFSDLGYYPSADLFLIDLDGPLQDLSDPNGVWIDGTTQPTAEVDDIPNIWITASDWPTAPHIFMIPSGSTTNILQGLMLMNTDGDVVKIDGSSNWINNCVIDGSKSGNGISIMMNASGNTITDNFIYGNKGDGININSSNGNHILRNEIGVGPDYITNAEPNEGDGINCLGSNENEISENVINDNQGDGIQFTLCEDNEITDNFIGGNLGSGLYCSACNDNLIQGNVIGLSDVDYSAYGNSNYGVLMENRSTGNDIFENFISGNAWDGIRLIGSDTSENVIESNSIGYGYSGGFIPNGQHGIGIYDGADTNWVGNFSSMVGANRIGGNGWSGVAVVGMGSHNNYIYHNYILSNQWYGIHVNNSPVNNIGNNVIHFNGLHGTHAGVRIEGTSGHDNGITRNSIHSNTGLGIELVDGGNGMMDPPLLYAADCHSVTGTACADCMIEIYSDDEYEGEFFEGQAYADGSGNFTYSNPSVCFHGPNITAIAINGWETSPFALPRVGVCMHFYLPMIVK